MCLLKPSSHWTQSLCNLRLYCSPESVAGATAGTASGAWTIWIAVGATGAERETSWWWKPTEPESHSTSTLTRWMWLNCLNCRHYLLLWNLQLVNCGNWSWKTENHDLKWWHDLSFSCSYDMKRQKKLLTFFFLLHFDLKFLVCHNFVIIT